MLATAKKSDIITKFRTHDSDTGSPEVQIAILSERIGELTEHFKTTKKTMVRAVACSCSYRSAAVFSITSRRLTRTVIAT